MAAQDGRHTDPDSDPHPDPRATPTPPPVATGSALSG